ncbi:hypothetical protein H5410_045607 [Solanum commersonii]|uniref:Integrase core domain containing protein n=1 Tax=Solanum commersonii TaxID=4109 RepID=A0A9J5XC38_SOLCO|nr:hypothetical protein H5410_045607 [Solanum commersonii]
MACSACSFGWRKSEMGCCAPVRDRGVPIWHYDKLVHAIGTLDIGLIQDDANVTALRRGSRVDVPMGEDVIHTVGQMQGDVTPTIAPPDEHPTSSSQTASHAPSSSRATALFETTMIPLARVQKFEAQMATLLHHIKPWMRKLIAESEKRIKLGSLWVDVDAILAIPAIEPQAAPSTLGDDTILGALSSNDDVGESSPSMHVSSKE